MNTMYFYQPMETNKRAKKFITHIFSLADVTMNGKSPHDIQVHRPDFYSRVLSDGSLGLGESYMEGWWDCSSIDQMICKVLKANLPSKVKPSLYLIWHHLRSKIFNLQSYKRAFQVGERHYDIGNDLFENMLDKGMNYSCGYWKGANDLDMAQEAKLDLICKKLHLQPGMHVLDIGCGWGSFAKYAATNYGVKVTGITVSKEQFSLAQENCKGLNVEFKLMDYRLLTDTYDAVVSIGMFEHVGHKNYATYFKKANQCLRPDGLFLLHTIGRNKTTTYTDPWIDKYIFHNSQLPSPQQITKSFEGHFRLEDWHNFGFDYDKTLMAWYHNCNKYWNKLSEKYSERFRRMWNYYLLSCAGSFRSGKNQLWQIVFSKINSTKSYVPVR